jgi:GAF domain-containing protein
VLPVLEMVAAGRALADSLDAMCRLVEQTVPGSRCSVVLIAPGGAHVEHAAGPSLPASFTAAIHGRPLAMDAGPCATAALLDAQVIAADLTTETRWQHGAWTPLALAHELRACWSTPIRASSGRVLGTFAIYYAQPRSPGADDQALIAQLTQVASIAIEHAHTEAALREMRAELDRGRRGDPVTMALRARYATLTPREREVMGWIVAGLLNKQVAAELGTREITVKTHRAKVMQKMGAGSFADLVRMATRLELALPGPRK